LQKINIGQLVINRLGYQNLNKMKLETTLTLDNLYDIYWAMKKIKKFDQSRYFLQYFQEVEERINELEKSKKILEYEKMQNL